MCAVLLAEFLGLLCLGAERWALESVGSLALRARLTLHTAHAATPLHHHSKTFGLAGPKHLGRIIL